ncbi:unnamed protein product [Rhizophagus irregularis]|nr:unnamed protein product [Rhizophagus irregularis]CAB5389632.1 unnamed protein product [Rhizophagus irregularis]
MESNIVAAKPFITAQGDCIMENNFVTNGMVFQIRGDLNDKEKLAQQSEDEILFQFRSNDNLNRTEDVLPPEFKRHKGRAAHKRIKSAIENNVRTTCKKMSWDRSLCENLYF